ncbi:fibronectin type III domain-containing protein [Paenibacillus sp. WLX2291]|uniref:fibronectin type III domain-containing protein n=1 Tax=Paenibacillus sp. WLX2291 TaxID=3296934 RepID=UPI0039842EA3
MCKKYIHGCLAVVLLLGSLTLPIGIIKQAGAEATSSSDLAFEQANYGSLVASGYVENPVLGSTTTGASSYWGYSAGTYYRYAKSIQANVSVPVPNDIGAAEYYVVVEAETSVAGVGGNGVTSYNRKINASDDGGNTYTTIWTPSGNGQAVGASNYSVYTEYKVVKINGPAGYGIYDNQKGSVSYAEYYKKKLTNMQIYYAWDSGYYETMKSLKYRVYRKDIPPTSAPVITVSPSETYHTGSNNSFTIAKPTYYGNYYEQFYGMLQYRIANGSWINYTGAVNISAEGEVKIESRLLTRDTLESLYGTAYSRLDRNKPHVPVIVGLDSTKWYRGTFDLTFLPGTDEGSGVNGVYYSLYGATEQARTKAATGGRSGYVQSITAEGQTIVTATTVDNVGWESDLISGKINIDNTPPVGVLTAPQGWATSVTISADGMDSASGFQYIRLPGNVAHAGSHYDYPVSSNGTYTFGFEDAAGNIASKSITIRNIDDVAPSVTISKNGATWTDQDIPVTFTFQDAESGLNTNKLYYKWTQSTAEPTAWDQAIGTKQTTTLSQEGVWYLHLKGYDLADNVVRFTSNAYQIQRQPEAPTLSVIGTATDQMLLSWSLPTNGANTDGWQYIVRNETIRKSWTINYPVNQLLDTDLSGGNEYKYTITAKNHVGSSLSSTPATGMTLPEATVNASVYASGEDYRTALLSITPVQSATGYRITATNWSNQQVDADVTVTGTTYQEVTGLKPYTMYDFSVRAVNASGEGAAYHISFLSLPDQPNNFKSVQMTENTITLSWNSVTRAVYDWSSVTDDTYYRLRRDNQVIFTGVAPSFQDTGLASGTAYDYDVAAGNSTSWGSKATLSQVWTLPAAPKQLQQVKATPTSFTVHVDIPHGSKGFQATLDGTKVIRLGSVLSEYTFTGLQPGTSHTLELAAYNQSGVGRSISMVGTTLPDLPASGTIAVSNIQENRATFDVYDVPGATKYKLTVNGKEYEVAAGETIVSGLQGGTIYHYSLAAGNAAGYGEAYTNHFLTLPSAPTGYTVTKHTPTSINLEWAAVKSAEAYEIRNSTGILLATVNMPAYSTTGLKPGETVQYRVIAKNASGTGTASLYTFRTLPGFEDDSPDYSKLVRVDHVNVHDLQIRWTAVPGADQYRVYDADQQLIAQTTEHAAVIKQLHSATRYSDYTVVPVNSTGEGKAMLVPTVETLPDGEIALSYDSTKTSITLNLKHDLTAEILVIAAQSQELYRGTINGYAQYVQDRLQPDSIYTFNVWTENENGDRSEVLTLPIKTKKEREELVTEAPAKEMPAPEVTEEPVISDSTPSDEDEPHTSTKKGFIDIDHSFAKESITRLADMGIVQGISDDLYAPSVGTTRAEFMAILTRLVLTPEQIKKAGDEPLSFKDIDDIGWYMPELRAAYQNGIVKGFSINKFAPNEVINREQAVKMLGNMLSNSIVQISHRLYSDTDLISQWALNDVNKLTIKGIIKGYPDETFRPNIKLNRAETAAMIDRAIKRNLLNIKI